MYFLARKKERASNHGFLPQVNLKKKMKQFGMMVQLSQLMDLLSIGKIYYERELLLKELTYKNINTRIK